MPSNRSRVCALAVAVIVATGLGPAGPALATAAADSFAAMMDTAMATMDRAMMAPSSGDPDRNFAAMMIPHHQGAIDMAVGGRGVGAPPLGRAPNVPPPPHETLRRLAQGIIVEQRQEIVVMSDALASLSPAPAADAVHAHGSMPAMSISDMQNSSPKGH